MKKVQSKWRRRDFILLGVAVVLCIVFSLWQNNALTVTNYRVESNKPLPQNGLRIVQLSDLHNKWFGNGQARLFTEIRAQNPDLIVCTGDMVDSRRTDLAPAFALAEALTEIAPTYYVSGNHELRLSTEMRNAFYDGLSARGVILLLNRTDTLTVRGCAVTLIGLDDRNSEDDTLPQIADTLSQEPIRILLAHEPQTFPHYTEYADIIFSGHTHGGQIRLPFVGGLAAPDQGLFPKYDAGAFQEGESTMFISRGLGNSLFPIRVFNRPEIVSVTVSNTIQNPITEE